MRGGAGAEEGTGLAWFCPAADGSGDSGENRGQIAVCTDFGDEETER